MHELTSKFLTAISNCKSKEEIKGLLFKSHKLTKDQLSKEGINFFKEGSQFSEDIIGNQIISGANNVYLAHYYEEINFIKYGITINWYAYVDKYDRYNEIRKQFEKIYEAVP